MQRGLPNVWSVHFRGRCYTAPKVLIKRPVESTFDPNGRQPRAKFKGIAKSVVHSGDTLIVQ